jgi:rubredoxin
MSVINLLIESFDLDKSLSYIESEKVKQAVKEQYPNLYPHGYLFKFNNILYAVYTFVRKGSLEIHFYDATNGITLPKKEKNIKFSIQVFSTVIKILYDELEKRKFNSISIGFNKSNQKLYYKIIEKMTIENDLFSLYIFPPKIVKLVSGYDAYKLELKEALIAEGFLESHEEEEWVCEVCGHVHRGKKPPKECPLCRVEKEYFKKKSKDVTRG